MGRKKRELRNREKGMGERGDICFQARYMEAPSLRRDVIVLEVSSY